ARGSAPRRRPATTCTATALHLHPHRTQPRIIRLREHARRGEIERLHETVTRRTTRTTMEDNPTPRQLTPHPITHRQGQRVDERVRGDRQLCRVPVELHPQRRETRHSAPNHRSTAISNSRSCNPSKLNVSVNPTTACFAFTSA